MQAVPGALESDFGRFYGCGLHEVGVGKRVHWFVAARWVCNLPADAVTFIALKRFAERAEQRTEQARIEANLELARGIFAKRGNN